MSEGDRAGTQRKEESDEDSKKCRGAGGFKDAGRLVAHRTLGRPGGGFLANRLACW